MPEIAKSNCYIVIFQIPLLERRKALREALKVFDGYCPLATSAWAVTSTKTAPEIRDQLSSLLERGDRLYVLKSGGAGAWRNAMGDAHTDWLKKFL